VILSDLSNFSMTWSVARPLCDSWASCFYCRVRLEGLLYDFERDLLAIATAAGKAYDEAEHKRKHWISSGTRLSIKKASR